MNREMGQIPQEWPPRGWPACRGRKRYQAIRDGSNEVGAGTYTFGDSGFLTPGGN